MRVLVYFATWAGLTLVLLLTAGYLMTLVDPGLRGLPEKAARVLRNEPAKQDVTILPPAQYLDFDELVRNKNKD